MRGLLGKTLSHSYSKIIHEKIDQQQYNLIEVDDLDSFFQEKTFKALNVTIPYKEDVIKYLHEVSPDALELKSVNTIINENDTLKGYNTDIDGFEFLLSYNNISLKNKVVGILGNGATSRTVSYVSQQNKAKEVCVFARNPKENEYSLHDMNQLSKVNILINATPSGMYPNNNDPLLVDINELPTLEAVIDLVYNPLRTTLLLAAEELNIKAVNGLIMLIHQAVKANELFNNTTHSTSITIDIYKELLLNTLNIVLIGMPMSGKTYYGKEISNLYHKELIDIDFYIEQHSNKTIPEIFDSLGEIGFRKLENELIKDISKQRNLAISTGGGIVLNKHNVDFLKQNGLLIFLDMPLQELVQCNPKGRPLLKTPEDIENLYTERYDLYVKYCDKRVLKVGFNKKPTIRKIEVKINEYLNS